MTSVVPVIRAVAAMALSSVLSLKSRRSEPAILATRESTEIIVVAFRKFSNHSMSFSVSCENPKSSISVIVEI